MPIVTYDGKEYECATAIKGPDYIRLLDASDCKIVTFEGIVDFSLFTISSGKWTTPHDAIKTYLPKVTIDGSICKSDVPFSELSTTSFSIVKFTPEDFVTDDSIPGYYFYLYTLPKPLNLGTYIEPTYTLPFSTLGDFDELAPRREFICNNLALIVPGETDDDGKVLSFAFAFRELPTEEFYWIFKVTKPVCNWQL